MSTDDRTNPMFVREPEPKEFYSVEAKADPQRGFPELWWHGKRPFTGVSHFPAQHKERHGAEVLGWRNQIYWGDNLQVMGHLLRHQRGEVKLIYIDPPFDSKADYKKRIEIRSTQVTSDRSGFEEKQYGDIWTNDEYLQFMWERVLLMRELLHKDGVIWLQSDHRKSHHLRCLLDSAFGPGCHLNTVSWRSQVARGAKVNAYYFPASTQTIHVYGKSVETATYNIVRKQLEISEEEAARDYNKDEGGYFRTSDPGSYSYESLKRLHADGRVHAPKGGRPVFDDRTQSVTGSNGGSIGIKYYLKQGKKGAWYAERAIDNIWDDVPGLGTTPGESVDYPTQKPEALLRRIIEVSTNPGDLVFDCFMGSGTTQAVAMKLGRRFLGADINLGSIQTATKRLLDIAHGVHAEPPQLLDAVQKKLPIYTGLDVFTVNQYDLFRNEPEARALLMEALAIRPLPGGEVWHGELGEGSDTRLVRFMPINRIATRADLDPIIKNLDWKSLAKRRIDLPNKPVLRISLVCMGHEPELSGLLAIEIRKGLGDSGAKLDIEVVDILRQKEHIEFKRASHAQVTVKKGTLRIERFYPMNLLQKLSLDKTAVGDWRELVESVFIDFNYDGKVLTPSITDVPDGKELVKGEYDVPKGAKLIRVKITDLLSDALEVNVEADHG